MQVFNLVNLKQPEINNYEEISRWFQFNYYHFCYDN